MNLSVQVMPRGLIHPSAWKVNSPQFVVSSSSSSPRSCTTPTPRICCIYGKPSCRKRLRSSPPYLGASDEWSQWRNRLLHANSGGWFLFCGLREVHLLASKEEELHFQAMLLEAVGQSVVATDLEGNVLYWIRAAQEIYG